MKKVNRIKENPKQGCGREMENKKSSEEVAQKRGEKKNKSYKRAAVTATQICRAKGTRRIYNEKKNQSIYNDRSEAEYYVHRPVTENSDNDNSSL